MLALVNSCLCILQNLLQCISNEICLVTDILIIVLLLMPDPPAAGWHFLNKFLRPSLQSKRKNALDGDHVHLSFHELVSATKELDGSESHLVLHQKLSSKCVFYENQLMTILFSIGEQVNFYAYFPYFVADCDETQCKNSHLISFRSSAICENQCSDSHIKQNFVLLSTLFCPVLYKICLTTWPQFIEWLWVLWQSVQWKRFFPEGA